MMQFHRRQHEVPGLNTTSTADISFMLLIFFLVTTNMDIDKGLQRQLPPADKQEQQESYVEKGTTMALRGSVENFGARVGKRHLITLAVDPASCYDTYFQVQNELVAAYNVLRDRAARRLYGRDYAALTQTEKDKVKDVCPQRIAEQYVGPEKGGAQ